MIHRVLCALVSLITAWTVRPKPLLGRVALVTGASRGIGKGIALGLAEQGATVIVTGRSCGGVTTDKDVGGTLEDVVDEIYRLGGQGHAIKCDHRNDADVAATFAAITADHGRLDILVNNAFAVPTRPDGQGMWVYMYVPFTRLDGALYGPYPQHLSQTTRTSCSATFGSNPAGFGTR